MGFKTAKNQLMSCLKAGNVFHEARSNVDRKNLLLTEVVSVDDVALIIARSRGNSYSSSPHHVDKTIDVHIIKTNYAGFYWYIKWYFVEPDCIFISVHH